MTDLFDTGLQPERTALAWRRTGLALLAASLVATRVLPEVLGAGAAALGLLGVGAAAALLFTNHHRYRQHHESLVEPGDRFPLAGGRLIAAVTVFVLGAGVTSVLLTLVVAVIPDQ